MDDPWNQNPLEDGGLQPVEAGQRAEQPGPEPPALQREDRDNRAQGAAERRGPKNFSGMEKLLISMVILLVGIALAAACQPLNSRCWGPSLPNRSTAQSRIWEKLGMAQASRASPTSWNKIDSSPDSLESFSYDSFRDRVLREQTSVPLREVEPSKPESTSLTSRDKTQTRKASPDGDFSAFTAKTLEHIDKVKEAASEVGIEPKVQSKTNLPFPAEDLEGGAEKVAERITSALLKTQTATQIDRKIQESNGVDETVDLGMKSKEASRRRFWEREVKTKTAGSESQSRDTDFSTIATRRKGSYENWWSEFRLSGPPIISPTITKPVQPKQQRTTKSTENLIPDAGTKSITTRKRGRYELWWSARRLQGPPTMASSSSPTVVSSPFAPKSRPTQPVTEKKKDAKDEHFYLSVLKKTSDKSKSKSTLTEVHSVDVPLSSSSDKLSQTKGKAAKQEAETAKASPWWPWKKTSEKPRSKSTWAEAHSQDAVPPSGLKDIKPTKQELKYTRTIKVSPQSPSKKKRDKWRNGVSTVTEIRYVDAQDYPTSAIFTPTAENPKYKDRGPQNQEPTKTNLPGVLADSIIEALNGFYFLSPLEPARQKTWTARVASFLNSSSVKRYFANFKTWLSSLPGILTGQVEKVNKPIGEAKGWWSNLVKFTRSERERVKREAPEEPIYDDKFFNFPSYQHRTSKNKTAEAILDISGTLYSVIDQLMTEGNQHFADRTHLQAAFDGLSRAESVMNSSRTVKTMAKASENRNLLTTYVGVVHKFGRLVTDVAEATDRIARSPVVTESDVTYWNSVKGGFHKFLTEVKKRPLFVNRELVVSEGFHRDILIDGRDKLESARSALEKLTAISPI
ncbi:hypothetical protein IFR05_013320 [Cadophora sp. M221]|nr:hypothetical protein IFR05_013320 [Cadophora sp. M221]